MKMNILVVDDRQLLVNMLCRVLHGIDEEYEVFGTVKIDECLKWTKKNKVDVAFLDIEMRDMNGIELAKKINDIHPHANIIFVTGHKEYAMEAYSVYPAGYILKPVDEKEVKKALSKLRYPIEERKESKKLRVQCFGEFEVFFEGKPLRFRRSKTKELFAYLVCLRGASVSISNIVTVLWEDSEDNPSEKSLGSMCRNLVADLQKTLQEHGLDDIIIKEWKSVSVNTATFDCDYYDYIKEHNGNLRYSGDFMAGYSWAEYMIPRD